MRKQFGVLFMQKDIANGGVEREGEIFSIVFGIHYEKKLKKRDFLKGRVLKLTFD